MKALLTKALLLFLLGCVCGYEYRLKGARVECFPVDCGNSYGYIEVEVKSPEPVSASIIREPWISFFHLPEPSDYNLVTADKYWSTATSGDFSLPDKLANLKRYMEIHPMEGRTRVEETGFYCVYFAPPSDGSHAHITVKHWSGYLNSGDYPACRVRLWSIPLTIILTAVLLGKSAPKYSRDWTKVPVVVKCALPLFVLHLAVDIFCQVDYHLKNLGVEWPIFAIGSRYLKKTCLVSRQVSNFYLCMGYGVLYYHRPTRYLRELPQKKKYVIISIVYIVAAILEEITQSSVFGIPVHFILYISMIVQYFKTKKEWERYPPHVSTVEDEQNNRSLSKAFTKSVMFILVLPIASFVFTFIFAMLTHLVGDLAGQLTGITHRSYNGQSNTIDYFVADKSSDWPISQDRLMRSLGAILDALYWWIYLAGLYFIWIKDNVGVVAERKTTSPAGAHR